MLRKKSLKALLLAGLFMSVNGCEGWFTESSLDSFSSTEPQKKLRVLTVKKPLTYVQTKGSEGGLEHDLLVRFARDMNYAISFTALKDEYEVLSALRSGRGDLAAARVPSHLGTAESLVLSPAYDEQPLVLICPTEKEVSLSFTGSLKNAPLSIVALKKDITPELQKHFEKNLDQISIKDMYSSSTLELLRSIVRGNVDCALVDKWEAQMYIRFFNRLSIVTEVGVPLSFHFVSRTAEKELQRDLFVWFKRILRQGELARIKEGYSFHLNYLSAADRRTFFKALKTQFKEFEHLFKKAAREFQLPWQLVAAVAFQESHWQVGAESFTGVKGIMQITLETAEHLGISDRENPEESIWGGAKYLRYLIDAQPSHLSAREKWALALAAYNVGPAHLQDAQSLAQRFGKNPLAWRDLKTLLPLLSNPKIAETLRYGPARGEEPVDFVHRVFSYYDLLALSI